MAKRKRVGIKLDFDEFEKLIRAVAETEENADKWAKKYAYSLANDAVSNFYEKAKEKGVHDDITKELGAKVTGSHGTYHVASGFELGTYNPKNLSQGYKAVFLNYGAARGGEEARETLKGLNRGTLPKLGFIDAANKQTKKDAEELKKIIYNEMMKELKK